MRTRFIHLHALLGLSLGAADAAASDHVVFVGDGAFDPKNLTISAGDTVTFRSFGNTYSHNVHALDDSFRCSKGCRDDGSGSTGEPAKEWSDTLTFSTPKVIGYQCDPHAIYGMSGTINVVAATPGLTLRPGISGNWYDPSTDQAGHGFQFEILPNNSMLAIWFVFTPDGSGQTWLYAQGDYDPTSSTVTMNAYLSLGAKFPPNFNHADDHVTQWGTLTFTFTDCSNGTMSWTSTTAGYPATGTMPIKRATSIAGTTCP